MPSSWKAGLRMFWRCSGEFSHSFIVSRGVPYDPVPHAMFSPSVYELAPVR